MIENLRYHDETKLWFYQLLQHLGPHLEEVTVYHPSCKLLSILNSLPNLSRLCVEGGGIFISTEPLVCAPVGRLKEFSDGGFMPLPTHALTSIIKSHCHTLEMITVSDNGIFQDGLGLSKFLKAILGDCKFPALKNLSIGTLYIFDAQNLDDIEKLFLE